MKLVDMFSECPWCEEEYEITQVNEQLHLVKCSVFQTLPVFEVKEGKVFVALPSDPNILCERVRIN